MRIILLLTTLGLFFLAGCVQKPADEIMLRYSFVDGREKHYQSINKQQVEVSTDGKDSQTTISSDTIEVLIKCNEIKNDTTAEFYEKIINQNIVPNQTDSAKIDTVTNKIELIFDIYRSGKITNIRFDSSYGPHDAETYRRTMEQTSVAFPDHPVRPGYEWKKVTKVYHEGKEWESEINSTFKAIVRESGYDCALIEVKGNSVVPVEVVKPDGTKMVSFDVTTLDGYRYLAFKEGLIIRQYEHKQLNRQLMEITGSDTAKYNINVDHQTTMLLTKAVVN